MGRWPVAVLRRWRSIRSQADRGYNLVETVIIVPVIIVFTMLVVQFAMLWHARHIAQAAAAAAARAAAGYSADAAQGRADAAGYLAQVAPNLLSQATVTVDRGAATVTVAVHASALSVIPFGSFSVDERAAVPVEQFVLPPGAPG